MEILRYKTIIAQVLLESFVVQLFGLVTPLFTQVILDKVLVHRTISTLNVLGFAFLVVAFFEFLLNTSRNYIFIHTTNKIDAKLGAKLFRHLFRLYYVYTGVLLVIENKLTIGQLIAFQMFAGQFSAPMLRLVNLWNEFQQTLLAVDRIGDILNSPAELQNSNAITLSNVQGNIKLDNLSFRYNVEAPMVLKRVNLEIRPGMKVGFVGRSGSGKSTLTKLIQRLYYPTDGTIYIDGIDIRNINPIWLRTHIGVVLQENYLFSGTIKDNIALPRPNLPMEAIIQASQIAGAHEFISKMPKGYDTEVGERGSSLSGGQRQRIAIVRALITNPRILILDEATSALDYESERIIRNNLAMITQNRTTIIIAHRLSTIQGCDMVVCFDEGEIVEVGTHEELIQKEGYYKNLYNAQIG